MFSYYNIMLVIRVKETQKPLVVPDENPDESISNLVQVTNKRMQNNNLTF